LPTNRGLRREIRRIVAEGALDFLDRVPEIVFVVGANCDEYPLVEDVRSALDGLVGRSGFVCSLLEVRITDALLEVSVDLEVVGDIL